jgi:lysophospholipid hydrolase
MFTGGRSFRGIRKLLGKLRIQDLVLHFFCVSVDLKSQEAVIHTKGLLCWKYIRASMTLAGYLPPIADNGSLLVDGSYLNARKTHVNILITGCISVAGGCCTTAGILLSKP